jgi:hypothetical protein
MPSARSRARGAPREVPSGRDLKRSEAWSAYRVRSVPGRARRRTVPRRTYAARRCRPAAPPGTGPSSVRATLVPAEHAGTRRSRGRSRIWTRADCRTYCRAEQAEGRVDEVRLAVMLERSGVVGRRRPRVVVAVRSSGSTDARPPAAVAPRSPSVGSGRQAACPWLPAKLFARTLRAHCTWSEPRIVGSPSDEPLCCK